MINEVHALVSAPPVGTVLTGGSGAATSISSVAASSSLLPIASIVLEILGLLVGAVIVGIFIIIVVANRAEPDETGNRPQSVYFFAVSFVALVSTILGSVVVVFSVVTLIGHHSPNIGNAVARAVVIGGLVTVLSGALLWTHLRRGAALVGPGAANPSRRVAQSYVSAVAFLSVLILLVVTIVAVYLVFALAGPAVFGRFGGRTSTVRNLIDAVYIGLVAGTVLLTHRNLVTPGLRFFGNANGSESESRRGTRGTRGRHASGDATPPPPVPTSTPLPFTPPGAPPPASPS